MVVLLAWTGELALICLVAFATYRVVYRRATNTVKDNPVGTDPDIIDVDYYRSLK